MKHEINTTHISSYRSDTKEISGNYYTISGTGEA